MKLRVGCGLSSRVKRATESLLERCRPRSPNSKKLRWIHSLPSPVPSPSPGPVRAGSSGRAHPARAVRDGRRGAGATRAVQRRVRDLPSRVVVYLLLAACLFAEVGYPGVWRKLTAGAGRAAGRRAHRRARWPRPAAGSGPRRCGGCSTCCAARPPPRTSRRPAGAACW